MSTFITGVDVSHYQGTIDWKKAKAASVDFAFIKATEGHSSTDTKFHSNWAGSGEASVIRGAYHYFIPTVSVQKQAAHFIDVVGSLEAGDLAPALDAENPEAWAHLSKKASVDLLLEWCEAVMAKLEMRPFIYANPSFVDEVLGNDPRLAANPLWLAQYTRQLKPTIPKPWTRWTIWQHSQSGRITGIPEAVDLDYFDGTLDDLKAFIRP